MKHFNHAALLLPLLLMSIVGTAKSQIRATGYGEFNKTRRPATLTYTRFDGSIYKTYDRGESWQKIVGNSTRSDETYFDTHPPVRSLTFTALDGSVFKSWDRARSFWSAAVAGPSREQLVPPVVDQSPLQVTRIEPNPAMGKTQITYIVREAGPVQLSIQSETGVPVLQVLDAQREAGMFVQNFDVSQLRSGLYSYVLRNATFVTSGSFIVQH